MNKLSAAISWLDRGALLLPAQPGSKYLVAGFGPNLKKITSPAGALAWFGPGKKSNMAVFCADDLLALDFDDAGVLARWLDHLPTEYLITYQEISPRGMHFFFRCWIPEGLRLVAGVEIKRVVLVAPSIVEGHAYQMVDPDLPIVAVDDWEKIIFSLLSEDDPGEISPPGSGSPSRVAQGDLVSKIKAAFKIQDLAASLTELKPSDRSGRWWKALCPFHDDKNPSFWLDRERGLWGCHACGIRGDVINLYSRAHDLTLQGAIREMASQLGVRSAG